MVNCHKIIQRWFYPLVHKEGESVLLSDFIYCTSQHRKHAVTAHTKGFSTDSPTVVQLSSLAPLQIQWIWRFIVVLG